jgi:hypothetical protein
METAPAREAAPGGPRFGLATATFVVVERTIVSSISVLSIIAGVPVYYYLGNSAARRRPASWFRCRQARGSLQPPCIARR